MLIEELRNKIRDRFAQRGWSGNKQTGVNDFKDRGQIELAKARYKDSVVIHYPFFYNNQSNWSNRNNKFFDNREQLSNTWRNNPQKYDAFVIEIINDILIEYLKINNLEFMEIIFQHYGTYDIGGTEWYREERMYDVTNIGVYFKV